LITLRTNINITPMSMKNGVLSISTKLKPVKNWDATSSIQGTLTYANQTDYVRATPKIKEWESKNGSIQAVNPAWQFTVNNPIQFEQLRIDGANTEIAGKVIGEKLVCDIDFFHVNGKQSFAIRIIKVELEAPNVLSKKLQSLIKQHVYTKKKVKGGIHWGTPTKWIDIVEVDNYNNVNHAVYMWEANCINSSLKYLYVGIVGDSKKGTGLSKRTLAQRIQEHNEKYKQEGINITRFRFDALLSWPPNADPAEILKTSEMRQITTLTAIIPCRDAQKQIRPLLQG